MAPDNRTELDVRAFVIAMLCGVVVVAVLTPILGGRTFGPPVIIVGAVALGAVLYRRLARTR